MILFFPSTLNVDVCGRTRADVRCMTARSSAGCVCPSFTHSRWSACGAGRIYAGLPLFLFFHFTSSPCARAPVYRHAGRRAACSLKDDPAVTAKLRADRSSQRGSDRLGSPRQKGERREPCIRTRCGKVISTPHHHRHPLPPVPKWPRL